MVHCCICEPVPIFLALKLVEVQYLLLLYLTPDACLSVVSAVPLLLHFNFVGDSTTRAVLLCVEYSPTPSVFEFVIVRYHSFRALVIVEYQYRFLLGLASVCQSLVQHHSRWTFASSVPFSLHWALVIAEAQYLLLLCHLYKAQCQSYWCQFVC